MPVWAIVLVSILGFAVLTWGVIAVATTVTTIRAVKRASRDFDWLDREHKRNPKRFH